MHLLSIWPSNLTASYILSGHSGGQREAEGNTLEDKQ